MDEEVLNKSLLRYNQLLIEAHNQFQLRNIESAIKSYELALQEPEALKGIYKLIKIFKNPTDIEKSSLIKTNLAIIYFHNCEYKRSNQTLQEVLEQLRAKDKKTEFRSALFIKILGNLCVINLIMTLYDQSKMYNEQAISLISSCMDPIRRQLFEELVYIYFRFTSFQAMGNGYFENIEQKYDGSTLACFYSSMGMNRELCNDLELAYHYYKKALETWQTVNENGFIVITLKRLITICQTLKKNPQEVRDYVSQLNQYMKCEEFNGLSAEVLFKDCERKLNCARDITSALKKLEENINYQKQELIITQTNFPLDYRNQFGEPLWKLALRLRLKRAMVLSQQLLQKHPDQQESLRQAFHQIHHSNLCLQQSQPQIIEQQMMQMVFTKESVNYLKAQINKIRKFCYKQACTIFFDLYFDGKQKLPIQQQYNEEQKSNVKNNFLEEKIIQNNFLKEKITPQNSEFQMKQKQQQQNQFDQEVLNEDSFHSKNELQNQEMNPLQSKLTIGQSQFQMSNQIKQQPFQVQAQESQILNQSIGNPMQLMRTPLQSIILKYKSIGPRKKNSVLINQSYKVVQLGDYLIKCNKNTNGRIQRFFRLASNNCFYWAAKDKYINDPNKIQYYHVSDIKGLVYGKATDVLLKSYNKPLETWLCFSLIMKTRSMDFYVEPEQVININPWVIALSEEIKRRNQSAYVLTPGQFLWRKIKFIFHWHFVENNPERKKSKYKDFLRFQDKKFNKNFIQSVVLFNRNQQKLPHQ